MGNLLLGSIITEGTNKNTAKSYFQNNKEVPLQPHQPKLQNIILANDKQQCTETQALKIVKKHNKECQDSKLIEDCLVKHFFMRSLEKQARAEIVKEMSLSFAEKGTVLFSQGQLGNYFYIIKEGKVDLIINGEHKKFLSLGENFGELALLHGAPRSGTIKAVTDCFFWVMEKKNFRKIVDHITHMTFEENKKFLQSISILASIEHEQKMTLCTNLYKEIYDEGTCIVKQGELCSCIYFIKEGEVNCSIKDKVVRVLKKGELFGERSILIDSARTMDVVTKTKCQFFSLSISTLQTMLGDNFRAFVYLSFIKNSFLRSKSFSKFNVKLLDQVFGLFKATNYEKDDLVFKEPYKVSSRIVVVVDGSLINSKTNEVIGPRGALIFDEDVISNSNKTIDYSITASPDCLIIQAETDAVLKVFKCNFNDLNDKSTVIERLKKVHLFKNFTATKLESLAQKIKIEKISNGVNVLTQGEEGTRFFIIKSGKVDISVSNKYIRTMNENEYLGERALFFKEPRSATGKANGNVEVFYLEKEDFITTIEANLKEFLMNRLYLQDNTVQLTDLQWYNSLGSGNYGLVSLVKSKKNNFFYAIKNISRKQVLYEQLHKNLELERSILLQIDHPFIVKLVKTLKDNNYIYFLMEYIKGNELFDAIREIGLLSKIQTQFYGASMMLAVEYLHERKFIFRDIKPENIMVVENGYIKLIDFGTAKTMADKTSTIIGTPHYMAPEVILGDGYSFQVDYWSIAICMYEFMCGAVPFGETAEEPMDVYLSIINDTLSFPSFVKDRDFKNLMQLMLNKNYLSRYSKLGQINSHIWFQNFNWDDLISMNMQPAFIPSVKGKGANNNVVPYPDYIKNKVDEWKPTEEQKIDDKTKAIFDEWYKSF